MKAQAAYLLDTFGGGQAPDAARPAARAALLAMWERLLA
jgi:hypothetical protein